MFKITKEHNKRKAHLEELREAHRALKEELEGCKDFVRIGSLKMAIAELEGQIVAAEEVLKDKRSLREYLDEDKAAIEEARGKISEIVQSKTLEFEITIGELVKDLLKDLDNITAEVQDQSDKFESAASVYGDKEIRWRSKMYKPVHSIVREIENLNKELLYRYSYR